MTKEEDIMAPYLAAAREEVRLKRLEERRRKIDAEIAAVLARRREQMDRINLNHWNVREPVTPLSDSKELVLKLG